MEIINIEANIFEQIISKIEELTLTVENLCTGHNKGVKEWLDSQDVCVLLNISKRTLQNYRDKGLIPYSQINNKIYYKHSDVNAFISNLQNKKA